MMIGDIDPDYITKHYVKCLPKMKPWADVILMAIRLFVEKNSDRPVVEKTAEEIDDAIKKAIDEDTQDLLDSMVADKTIEVKNVNGEDRYYVKE